MLYIILLGDTPGDSMSENDNGDFHDLRSLSIEVQSTMLHSMESELRVRFSNTDAHEMVDGLKALFASRVRIMKYGLRDKFLSAEVKEKTPAWKVTWEL